MTVTTTTYRASPRIPAVPLALLAFVAIILLAVAARDAVPAPVDVEVTYTEHATKHAEASRIRRCLEERGAESVWRNRSWRRPFTFYRTCGLGDGRIGLQIVQWSWKALAWKEVTSFVIKDGTMFQVTEYLTAIAKMVR